MAIETVNLLEMAKRPGGLLDGFGPSRWTPPTATMKLLIEATGGKFNPNDLFFGGSFEDELVYHPERKQWALCAEWTIAIVEAE